MKFLKLRDVSDGEGDLVIKTPYWGSCIMVVFCFGLACMFWCLAYKIPHRPPESVVEFFFLAIVSGGGTALIGLLAFGMARAGAKKTNWLIRFSPAGLFLKYRSYLSWRSPEEDFQVVQLNYSEVSWARSVKGVKEITSLGGETSRQSVSYLELGMREPDLSTLQKHLEFEGSRQWIKKIPLGTMTCSTKESPVTTLPECIIRITCSARNVKKAIHFLGKRVTIAPKESIKTDLTYNPDLSLEENEKRIAELAKSGDKMGAIRLTRLVYNCSLTEAVAYVENCKGVVSKILRIL